MKTQVYVRESKLFQEVSITSSKKPEISVIIKQKWQKIIDSVAVIFEVPAALIMHITKHDMEVFLKSNNEGNPYPADGSDSLGHGLYCETVIGTNSQLIVPDSLEDPIWKDNPDVALHMISYIGLPIYWSDGEVFGTICALDNKRNEFSGNYEALLYHFKEAIESDLSLLETNQKLYELSHIDHLTSVYNRRFIEEELQRMIQNYKRYGQKFSLVLIDIDDFKYINDQFGHEAGDSVLITLVSVIKERIRTSDIIARYGGDEFVLVFNETNEIKTEKIISDILRQLKNKVPSNSYPFSFSYGIVEIKDGIEHVDALMAMVDKLLYVDKNHNRNEKQD